MGRAFFFDWEPNLIAGIQGHMGGFLTSLASICSAFGEELVMVALLCFLYFWYDKNSGKFVGRRLMLAGVLNATFKNVFCRLRPYMVHDNVDCLKLVDADADPLDIAAQGYSFPSGHSSNASAVYLGTAVRFKKRWVTVTAVSITLLVGISRFCVGAHYPTDVMAGLALGVISIFGISILEKYCKRKWVVYLILALIGLPGMFFCTTDDYFSNYGMMIGFFLADFFEERFVRFENPKAWYHGLLRMLGGGAIYPVLNALLKLPFSSDFLASGTCAAHLVRFGRYIIVIFVIMGVYPLLFRSKTAPEGSSADLNGSVRG